MEEIIKILEEYNIKCVKNGNNLSLSHNNFYINVESVQHSWIKNKTVHIYNKIIHVLVWYEQEYIHITAL